ncbi:MAG TPA: hypothetical protein ENN23_08900 [Deltaproteobacteria bacterium]|nr:hypothetical protein [Deltaproteobacteria bacterium]
MKKTLMLSAVLMFFFTFVIFTVSIAKQSPKDKAEGPWPVYAITFGNGEIYTSLDAETWTLRDSGIDIPLRAITFGKDMFVAVGDRGTIVTGSRDGLKWTPVKTEIASDLRSVAFAKNIFVAVGADGIVVISPDGHTWTKTALLSPGKSLDNLVFGYSQKLLEPGYFIAINEEGTIFKSYDAITWESEEMKYTRKIKCVIYADEKFIAVGTKGRIMTSEKAFGEFITWLDRYSSTFKDLSSIVYGNRLYVAVGADGEIITSPDLWKWTSVKSGTKSMLGAVAYGRGKFIAVGTDGTILSSSDGKTWSPGVIKK